MLGVLPACSDSSTDAATQASSEDCKAAYQHLATLRLKSVAESSALSDSELAKHKANFSRLSEQEMKACTDSRTRAWARCIQALSDSSKNAECGGGE